MTPPIGTIANRETGEHTLARARERAKLIPDLLVDANRVANNVFAGWHGRRKRGIGENFWQFRPYVEGENMANIDWRRSARDDHIYVRDREWQAAHTLWLWVDESPSMMYSSSTAMVAKQSRALVLAFAMAELLARSGERLGWLGVSKPIVSRKAAEKLAQSLVLMPQQTEIPNANGLRSHSDLIIFSDFLEPLYTTTEKLNQIAQRGVRGHLVHIADPAEIDFPYSGRVEFNDPESNMRITAGNAASVSEIYRDQFEVRVQHLREIATKLGWSHQLHSTANLASQALVKLFTQLSAGLSDNRQSGGV